MAIRGNFTQANFDALIASEGLRDKLNLPATATYSEALLYFQTINTLDINNVDALNVSQQTIHDSFNWVEEVDGNLFLQNNSNLDDLSFLSNLTRVGGRLYLYGLSNDFRSLAGLDNLTSIGGDFYMNSNVNLSDTSALSNLNSIGGYSDLTIYAYSTAITNLDWLSGVTLKAGDDVNLFLSNANLSNVDGAENMTVDFAATVGGNSDGVYFYLNGNENVTKIPVPIFSTPSESYLRFNINGCNVANLFNIPQDVYIGDSYLYEGFSEDLTFNDLGCTLNTTQLGILRTQLLDQGYSYYVALWDAAYPDGKTDCASIINPDLTPDPFAFTSSTDQEPGATIESNTVTLQGFDGSLTLTITGGSDVSYSLNGGAFVTYNPSFKPTISSGTTLQLKAVVPNQLNTGETIYVQLGFGIAGWYISTTANETPMVVNPIPDQSFDVNGTWSYDISEVFEDAEAHVLTYSILNGPRGLKLTGTTLSGVWTLSDIGDYSVSLIATDELNAIGVDVFSLKIGQAIEPLPQLEEQVAANTLAIQQLTDTVEELTTKVSDLEARVTTLETFHPTQNEPLYLGEVFSFGTNWFTLEGDFAIQLPQGVHIELNTHQAEGVYQRQVRQANFNGTHTFVQYDGDNIPGVSHDTDVYII